MSHLPLYLMNRLNKTESAVFKLWMLYFQRISFEIMKRIYLLRQVIRSMHEGYDEVRASSINTRLKITKIIR